MSTRQKVDIRFSKFFSGQWTELLQDITLSSVKTYEEEDLRIPRSHVFSQEVFEERQVQRASTLAKEGLISRAVRSLESTRPAQATSETLDKLRQLHPQPSEPVRSSTPPGQPQKQLHSLRQSSLFGNS